MQFFKDDGCLFSLLGRENRTASRKQERVTHFFVEHRNSSSAGNVPVEAPVEVPVGVLVEIQEWNYARRSFSRDSTTSPPTATATSGPNVQFSYSRAFCAGTLARIVGPGTFAFAAICRGSQSGHQFFRAWQALGKFVVRNTSRHHREHQKRVCEKDRKSGCRLPCNLCCGRRSSGDLGNLWSCCWRM